MGKAAGGTGPTSLERRLGGLLYTLYKQINQPGTELEPQVYEVRPP